MADISMGTLYDMNKVAIVSMTSLTDSEFKKNLKKIKQFFLEKTDKYFMLLNRETYNFTLFNLGNKNEIAMCAAESWRNGASQAFWSSKDHGLVLAARH